jgi:hypothetical protein
MDVWLSIRLGADGMLGDLAVRDFQVEEMVVTGRPLSDSDRRN